MQLDESELRRPVDCDEHVQLAFRGAHLGNVDVEEADRIGLELLLCGLVALRLRQPADPMPLQATMQRRARQMRDGRLKRVQAIVEGQQSMPAEGDDHRLVLDRQDGGTRLPRTGRPVSHGAATSPLGDSLLIDAVALGQRPQALLSMLYRSTDCLCRRGAPVVSVQPLPCSAADASRR